MFINKYYLISLLSGAMLLGITAFAQAQDTDMPWEKIRGSAVDIAVGSDGSVAVIDRKGRVYAYGFGDGNWSPIGESMSRIAVDHNGVFWGVDRKGALRRYTGTSWNSVGEGAVDLAIDTDNTVYVSTNTGSVAHYNPKARSWTAIKGRAQRVTVDAEGLIWSVMPDGSISRRLDDAWIGVTGKATDIVTDKSGRIVMIGIDGTLYNWQENTASWIAIDGIKNVKAAALDDKQLWLVQRSGEIFAQGITDRQLNTGDGVETVAGNGKGGTVDANEAIDTSPIVFTKLPSNTKLGDLSIGLDGSVYGLSSSGEIRRWSNNENRFNDFPGQVDRIAIRDNGLPIAIGTKGNLVQHDGEAWRLVHLNLGLIDLALYKDNSVLALNSREQSAKLSDKLTSFTLLGAKGQQIAAQNDGAFWVIDSVNRLFQCSDTGQCIRQSVNATDLSIGPGGSLFIVDTNSNLRRFNESTKEFDTIRQGDTARVAVGPNDRPWVINNKGLVYYSNFFERDESGDRNLAIKTRVTENITQTPTTAITNSGVQIVESISFSAVNIPTTAPGYPNLGSGLLDITSGRNDIVLAMGYSDPCVEGTGRNWLYDGVSRSFTHLDYLKRINMLTAVAGETLSAGDLAAIGLSASDTKPPTTTPDIQALYMQWQENCTIPVLITYASSVFTDAAKVAANDYQDAVFDSAFVVSSTADVDVAADEVVVQVDGINTLRFFRPGDEENFAHRSDLTFLRVGIGKDQNDVWITNNAYNVYEFMPSSNTFELRSLNPDDQAIDIGVGHDGTVFIVNMSGTLKKWDETSKRFVKTNKSGVTRVAVDSRGNPIVANFPSSQTVYFGR